MTEERSTPLMDRALEAAIIAQDLVTQAEHELPPEVAMLVALEEAKVPEKVDAYHAIIKRLDHETKFWKDQEEEARAVRKACERATEALNDRLKAVMRFLDLKTVEGQVAKFTLSKMSIQKLVIEEGKIPPDYYIAVTKMELDKDRIRAELENNVLIDGASLEPIYRLTKSMNRGGK